jgi:predicted nuclease with TOPRIM domain
MIDAEAIYQYCDERGVVLFEVLRLPGKKFSVRHPDAKGGWIWNLDGVSRVPYRLNEVILVDKVFLVEGEKDVETLRTLGIVATTNPTGANGWRQEFAESFRDKSVVIIPDRDKPGRKWVERIRNSLSGIASSIKVIELPGLDPDSGADLTDWISDGHSKKELLDIVEATPLRRLHSHLPEKLDAIRHRNAESFEKKRDISSTVITEFSERGCFYRTRHNRLYFFENEERRLYQIDSDDCVRFVAEVTRLNPTEIEFKYTIEEIRTRIVRNGTEVQVYQLGHFDRVAGKLYISDLGGGVFVLTERGITFAANGIDGVLFESLSTAEPATYLSVSQRTSSLAQFLSEINFDERCHLPIEALHWLLKIWLYSLFVPELHRTRVIPLLVGPQGSGKTSCARLLGMLLLGSRFDVSHLESGMRGEQAFVAAISGSVIVAFDNADAKIDWLPDHLARYATGAEFTLRELYTTNQLAKFAASASLVLTAKDPQFRRPDVAERLLILPLGRRHTFIPESTLFDRIRETRNSLFSELIDGLQSALPSLLAPHAGLCTSRMADFAAFCFEVMRAQGRGAEAEQWLRTIWSTQASYAVEDDSVTEAIEAWLDRDSNEEREIETGPLFVEVQKIGQEQNLLLPKTTSAFGKRLRELEPALREALGIDISRARVGNTTRWKFARRVRDGSFDFHSPDSSHSLPPPRLQVAQIGEVSEISKNPEFRQTPDGATLCTACEQVFRTEAGWRAHILQKRCLGRT